MSKNHMTNAKHSCWRGESDRLTEIMSDENDTRGETADGVRDGDGHDPGEDEDKRT